MAITSDVDICNLALDLLDIAPIQSIETPESDMEETLARWYDQTRRDALRRHPWNFATKRTVLAPSATDPAFGWDTAFDLPTDYIRIKYINESVLVKDNPVPTRNYTIENDQILTGALNTSNTDQLMLVYISNFKNVTKMDSMFIQFLSTMLARNIAYKTTDSNTNVERLNSLMEKIESRAKSMNGQENPPIRVQRSRNRMARRTSGSVTNLDGTIVFND